MNDTPEDHAAILQRSAKGEAGRRQRKKPSSAGGLIALAIRSASRILAARNLKAKLAASCCEPQKTKGQYPQRPRRDGPRDCVVANASTCCAYVGHSPLDHNDHAAHITPALKLPFKSVPGWRQYSWQWHWASCVQSPRLRAGPTARRRRSQVSPGRSPSRRGGTYPRDEARGRDCPQLASFPRWPFGRVFLGRSFNY